jgi:hypothetical protein
MTDDASGRPNPSDDQMSTVPGDDPQPGNVAIDEEAVSEPVAGPDEDQPIEQTNVGRENMAGTGEWPDPDAPPTGPAPGTAPGRQEEIEARRAITTEPAGTSSSMPGSKQDGTAGTSTGETRSSDTDRGLATEIDPPTGFKEVLEADPETGGSSSIGDRP